ncbi:hypothetical protein K2173_026846 [Erythroxylum novogranatense]|uniref:O-fucosyltransferase family protein n=1 Tax=Erythroxylum novogranatense TaxID=1862640 RepID=A0AAV8U0A2_9ROSI|nr:hypothetical protein K2173_026846 [Erythroxylum novogranatense]
MVIKSKIKWIIILVMIVSTGSILIHLYLTNFSSAYMVRSRALTPESDSPQLTKLNPESFTNKKLWKPVNSLESLQPYANSRTHYPAPSIKGNGFIYAKVFGGFANIRSLICDLVTISRLLNATLVIPEIQQSLRSKGISQKFNSFSYLYDAEQFIASLKNDVIIVKSLPENLKEARKRNEFPIFKPKSSASPNFYLKEVLPKLKKSTVIGLILNNGGCLQAILPPTMSEFQRLRCRVAFHALQFRKEIKMFGVEMVKRLRSFGRPFLVFHPGLVRDTLAYHGCAELFQDVHTELIQYRRSQMIKQGILDEELTIESRLRRDNGSCPLMPEEVGLLLKAMGYSPRTIIYLAGSETFGGQRVLIPLRAMFENLLDRTCFYKDFSDLIGPEIPLHQDLFQAPSGKSEEQLKEEWEKAGPRPRPLPPPPDRPIYQHEKEGWYGWITETDAEPDPSPTDLRLQAHRLIWDALDYIVSVEADAFFPGFHNDGSSWRDFSSLVMGQRLYESASSRTYRPDRKYLANLFNVIRDNMYHPKHNWTLSVREHLNKSLSEEGIIRQSLFSKPISFLSHPLPECSCRISPYKVSKQLKGNDGRLLYGGEDECPKWMQNNQKVVPSEAAGEVSQDSMLESEEEMVDEQDSEDIDDKSSLTLPVDDEWDPND